LDTVHVFVLGAWTSTCGTGERCKFIVFATADDGLDFWGVDDFRFEVYTLEGDGACEDGVDDEGGVGA